MRRLFGAVAFASTLTCITLAGMNVPAAAADSARPGSMQFSLRTEGPASACADKCRVWVSASGMIRPETVTDFENFAIFASSRWISLLVAGLLRVHRWFHFVQVTQTKIPLRETTTDRSARSVVL